MSARNHDSNPVVRMNVTDAAESAVPGHNQVMVQAGNENFPVAAFFLPGDVRRHLLNLYGFARLADDLGDEVSGDRMARLDWLEREIGRTFSGSPRHPLMQRLAVTVNEFAIPQGLFSDLIEANRRDQSINSYSSIDQLVEYCSFSANPVGRMVLYVFSGASRTQFELSDSVCTGLQLVEHWQDVAEDYRAGRVYIPREDLERFGVSADELGVKRETPNFRCLMAFEVDRARRFLAAGAPLANTFMGRRRLAIVAFVAGGRSALNAIEKAKFSVLTQSPRSSRSGFLIEVVRTLIELRGK